MKMRFSSLTRLVLVLAIAGCARVDQTSSGSVNKSRNYGVQADPSARAIALSGQKYRNADGSIDYNAMRAVYGEPNTNIVMNPRATDVSTTASVSTVAVHPDELVFGTAEAQWLVTGIQAGDTLYCGAACGDDQFLRNVVSITTEGNQVVVKTTTGDITDIVKSGWLHGTQLIDIDINHNDETGEYFGQVRQKQPRLSYTKSGTVGPQNWSKSGSLSAGGGTVTLTGGVAAQVDYDIAVSGHLALPPVTVDTFNMTATVTPTVELKAVYTATGSFSKDQQLFSVPVTLGGFFIGPVEVSPKLTLTANAHIDASGTLTVTADGNASVPLKAGFTYTSAAGAAPVLPTPVPTYNASIQGDGQAAGNASVALSVTLAFNVYGAAGPDIEADGTVGVKVTATGSAGASVGSMGTSTNCSATLTAQMYFTVGGSVGLALNIASFSLSHSWPIPGHTWNFPDPAWSKTFQFNDAGTCNPSSSTASSSSGTSGSNGSTGTNGNSNGTSGSNGSNGSNGTSGSNGSTGTTSSTHGTNGSQGACGQDSACTGSADCCANDDGGASQCVDTQANSENCAICGQNCAQLTHDSTSACQSGVCSCTCPAGTLNAGKACVASDTSACNN